MTKQAIIALAFLGALSCGKDLVPDPKEDYFIEVQYNGSPTQAYYNPIPSNGIEQNGKDLYLRSCLYQDGFTLVVGVNFPEDWTIYQLRNVFTGSTIAMPEKPQGYNFQLLPAYEGMDFFFNGEEFGNIDFLITSSVDKNCFDALIDFQHFSYKEPFENCKFPEEICINEITGSALIRVCIN